MNQLVNPLRNRCEKTVPHHEHGSIQCGFLAKFTSMVDGREAVTCPKHSDNESLPANDGTWRKW